MCVCPPCHVQFSDFSDASMTVGNGNVKMGIETALGSDRVCNRRGHQHHNFAYIHIIYIYKIDHSI